MDTIDGFRALTLPTAISSSDDKIPPSRLTFTRNPVEKQMARGTARSLPSVIPPQKTLTPQVV